MRALGGVLAIAGVWWAGAGWAQSSPVSALAFSPDGKRLAVGGLRVVRLLAAQSGERLGELPGHAGAVTGLAFHPTGRLLLAGGGEPGRFGEIRYWDTQTRRLMRRWTEHQDALYGLALSPDGSAFVAGSYDHLLSAWQTPPHKLEGGKLLVAQVKIAAPYPRLLKDHTDAVYDVAFHPKEERIASVAGDRTVKIWDANSGKRLFTLSESTAELYGVAFAPNGNRIAAGGADKTLRVWNLTPTGGTLARAAFAHQGAILRVVYAPDGKTIFTCGEDGAVKRWDAETLTERQVYPKQSDWAQSIAISPDGRRLAVGRHDGTLLMYDTQTTRLLWRKPALPAAQSEASFLRSRRAFCQTPPRKTGGATLFQSTLDSMTPTGAQRGKTTRFTLYGRLIREAKAIFTDEAAIQATILPAKDANPNVLTVEMKIGEAARIGLHRIAVQTPNGTTGGILFAVGGWEERVVQEPNDAPAQAQRVTSPATLIGALEQPGDTERFQFEAKAGEELVFEVLAQPIRSRLKPVLTLLDASGKTLAESKPRPGQADAILGHRFATAGTYTLQLKDFQNQSGGDVHYRLNIGAVPYISRVFPLGVPQGKTTSVQVEGLNLGGRSTLEITAPNEATWGTRLALPGDPRGGVQLAVGSDPEILAAPGAQPQPISLPATVNGKLTTPSHAFRFTAKKGQSLWLEVLARRLGSPLDSQLEITDSRGKPIERAVLRAVGKTEIVLSDRDSASGGLRLQAWDDFRINDFVLAGREVIRILRLPAGPDEDVFFRTLRGQRRGYFGTTPEFHSVGEPVYKVEAHPPGSVFSNNGMPLTKVFYQNDDGGALYGKDSALEFTAPADGDYFARLSDTRGQFGADYAYRLAIHPPRPEFRVTMNPAHPNVLPGGGVPITVECDRYEGFEGAIAVRLEGLPPGFRATETTIEAGETSATILLTTEHQTGVSFPQDTLRLVAEAVIAGRQVVRRIEPENGARRITLLPTPDVAIRTNVREVTIRPGEEAVVEAQIERLGEFGARVPIDVRNLPFGVRALDIGLNGILITEQDTARKFVIYCEPWVKAQTRAFYVSANVEGGTLVPAEPLLLRVLPPRTASRPALQRKIALRPTK